MASADSVNTPTDLALRYLEIYYSSGDPADFYDILSPNLVFEGPFARFDSARAYVEALEKDPPAGANIDILHLLTGGDAVNVLYRFRRSGIDTMMSQLFETAGGRIVRILLIFDSGAFR